MARTARKYIIIPEYAPLYAMQRCFGPTHGPLKQPTPTPVDIIGMLLLQKGNEKLTIMEVVKKEDGSFSHPVLLTTLNYRLPYDEIVAMENSNTDVAASNDETESAEATPVDKAVVVAPETSDSENEDVADAPLQDQVQDMTSDTNDTAEVDDNSDTVAEPDVQEQDPQEENAVIEASEEKPAVEIPAAPVIADLETIVSAVTESASKVSGTQVQPGTTATRHPSNKKNRKH